MGYMFFILMCVKYFCENVLGEKTTTIFLLFIINYYQKNLLKKNYFPSMGEKERRCGGVVCGGNSFSFF